MRIMLDARSKELLSIVIAPKAGLENFAMFNRCHVTSLHKTEECLVLNFVKMEAIAEMLMMGQTAISVYVLMDFKAVTARKRSMSVHQTRVKMVQYAKI